MCQYQEGWGSHKVHRTTGEISPMYTKWLCVTLHLQQCHLWRTRFSYDDKLKACHRDI